MINSKNEALSLIVNMSDDPLKVTSEERKILFFIKKFYKDNNNVFSFNDKQQLFSNRMF